VTPHGHRDRQQDRHDGERNQQGGHRVTALRATIFPLAVALALDASAG
jgi:hypothetical protein